MTFSIVAAIFALLVAAAFLYVVIVIGRLKLAVEEMRGVLRDLSGALPATAEPQPVGGEFPEETVAVIAAAATTLLGSEVQVRQVRQISTGSSAWAQQGRASVQGSHNLTRG